MHATPTRAQWTDQTTPNSISSPMNGGGDQRCGADEESAEDEVAAKVRPIHRRGRSVGNERRFCSSVSQVAAALSFHTQYSFDLLTLTLLSSRYTHSMLCLPITTHARAVSHDLLLIQAPCMPAPLPHLCSSYRAASGCNGRQSDQILHALHCGGQKMWGTIR
jgi:hypothetical protein